MAGASDFGPRMDRVTVARQGADLEAAYGNGVLENLQLGLIGQQFLWPAVRRARVVAGADLDTVQAGRSDAV